MKISLRVFLLLLFLSIFFQGISFASEDPWKAMGIIKRVERPVSQDFFLSTPEGNKISLSGLRGKVVLLNFWATWCVPCRTEMSSIERLHKKLKDKGLRVLGVDIMESPKKVKAFMEEKELTFPTVIDKDKKVSELYRVNVIPTTILIDKAGRKAGHAFGEREWDSEEAFELIDQLLRE